MSRRIELFIEISIFVCVVMFVSTVTKADEVAAATSEDLMMFEKAAIKSKKPEVAPVNETAKQKKSANFGERVSAEAKKLRESDSAQRAQTGKWVSGQRRNDDQVNPSASVSGGSAGGNNGNGIGHTTAPGIGKRGSSNGNPK